MGQLALRSGCNNGALNYRVLVNDTYDRQGSKPTLRPSVASTAPFHRGLASAASTAVAGVLLKSRALKSVHLNATKDNALECNSAVNNSQEEERNTMKGKEKEKHKKKKKKDNYV